MLARWSVVIDIHWQHHKVRVCSLKRKDDIFNGTCLYTKYLPHLVRGWHVGSREVHEGNLVFHGEDEAEF